MFDLDDGFRDAAIGKNSADFPKEILKQAIGVRERVWPSGVIFRSMPVITGLQRPLEFRSRRRDALFEVVDAAVEGQQELQAVVGDISYDDIIS